MLVIAIDVMSGDHGPHECVAGAVHALQAADRVPFTPLDGWPRPPIFISEATGYWPTVQTVTAQVVLTAVYLMGAVYVFGVKPRLARRAAAPKSVAPTAAPA